MKINIHWVIQLTFLGTRMTQQENGQQTCWEATKSPKFFPPKSVTNEMFFLKEDQSKNCVPACITWLFNNSRWMLNYSFTDANSRWPELNVKCKTIKVSKRKKIWTITREMFCLEMQILEQYTKLQVTVPPKGKRIPLVFQLLTFYILIKFYYE